MTYALTPVTASCPACRHTDGRLLYTTMSAEATQHYVRLATDPARHEALQAHIETLWGKNEARLVRCDTCGLTFCDPFVAGDERFYTLAYERDTYPQHRWEFGVTRDDIARRRASGDLPASPRVLEVGAGDGAFVRTIAPSPVAAGQITCTEYSAYGRERLAAEGVRVLADDVRVLGPEHDGAYDVIALFQVFEHMADLDALVGAFDRLLRPGGIVYVSVPNGLRIDLQEQCGGLLDMPPNHTGRWTRSAFEAFAGRHGWRVADHRVESDTRLARLRAHVEQRFMRSRQQEGTVAAALERLPLSRSARRIAQGLWAVLHGIGSLGAAGPLLRHPDAGETQWAALERA